MPNTKKVRAPHAPHAPRARQAAPGTTHAGTTAPAGTTAGGVTGGTTTSGSGGVIFGPAGTMATSGESGWGTLRWFTVDPEGTKVLFDDNQAYVLEASLAGYGAMFSTLLACWLEQKRVNLTYAVPLTPVVLDSPDADRRIISLTSI